MVRCYPIRRVPLASLRSLSFRQLALYRASQGPVSGPSYCGPGGRVTCHNTYGFSFVDPNVKMGDQSSEALSHVPELTRLEDSGAWNADWNTRAQCARA